MNPCDPVACGGQLFPCTVDHFDSICDVTGTKLLGLASELVAAEVISKNKNDSLPPNAEDGQSAVGVDLQRKIRSLRLPFMGAGPIYMHHYHSTSFDLQTHY